MGPAGQKASASPQVHEDYIGPQMKTVRLLLQGGGGEMQRGIILQRDQCWAGKSNSFQGHTGNIQVTLKVE